MIEFRMPSLGADMEAGTLVAWRVAPGEHVHRGQIIVEVETEKGAIDVECWQAGVVDALAVPVGTKVPVGTVLATLREEGEAHTASPEPAPAPPSPERPLASPAARRRAHELNVDLATQHGTGPHGAITVDDVERAAGLVAMVPKAPAPQPDRTAAMRHAIGAAMARSKREIPHYYLATSVDLGAALAWLKEENLARPVTERLLPAVLLLKAVALALRDAPELNGFWVDGAFHPGAGIHVGVAISLRQGGLIAPAIHDTDRLSLPDLMRALADVTQRARGGALRASELSDPTVTVTALGDRGVEVVYGVIHPPQVALVGVGRTTERPWAVGGMLGVRPVVDVTLAADHRASDGHRGALFLNAVGALLQHPEKL